MFMNDAQVATLNSRNLHLVLVVFWGIYMIVSWNVVAFVVLLDDVGEFVVLDVCVNLQVVDVFILSPQVYAIVD